MSDAQLHGSYQQYYLAKWRSSTTTEKLIALGASAYVGLAITKASLVGTLHCIGFSSVGPVAHSWAAAWQSAVATAAGGGAGHHAGHNVSAALFSWAQHVAMTWNMFTPSAAVAGIIAAVYFSSGYITQSARSVLRAGVFGGEEESRPLLVSSGGDGYLAESRAMMMEIESEVGTSAPDLISLEEGGGGGNDV